MERLKDPPKINLFPFKKDMFLGKVTIIDMSGYQKFLIVFLR